MTREQAKEYMLTNSHAYLQKDKSGKGFICPLCGNGTGQNGTGLRSKDNGKHFKCFKCGFYGDIIELIAKENGLTDGGSSEAFELARKAFKIEIDNTPNTEYTHKTYNTPRTQNTDKTGSTESTPNTDSKRGSKNMEEIIEYIKRCRVAVGDTDYLESRGISTETAKRLNVGYDESKRAIIIPTQSTEEIGYTERLIVPKNDLRYINRGKVGLFNLSALQATSPVFITEGAIDAMSIIEVGYSALAINSVSNTGLLLTMLKQMQADKKPIPMLYIAMDNDAAGESATISLMNGLKELGLNYGIANLNGACKDANESLTTNRGIFSEVVREYAEGTREKPTLKPVTEYLQGFLDDIKSSVNTPAIPTGFKKLDDNLGGGLFEGLYVVGAVSSLGKTTLVMQIADQIAQSGQDVLIFSLEMARAELMAKSISRHTLLDVQARGLDSSRAKTQLGITDFNRYAQYSTEEKAIIGRAIKDYEKYSNHLYIYEGIGNIGVEEVRKAVKNHIFFTGKTPVVIIDYLQILAPYDTRATDKQNTDKAVIELKRVSRDYKLPVLAISSFNRDSYTSEVSMASFKESGAIEYSSDVLIGLQFEGVSRTKNGEGIRDYKQVEQLYQANPRKIELKILKNRKGRLNDKVSFSYYPMFNLFKENDRTVTV